METKARIYEIRTKELADEKSVLQEELKLITTVRDTLAEHNHRLLEETQLKDKQLKALQEKVAASAYWVRCLLLYLGGRV